MKKVVRCVWPQSTTNFGGGAGRIFSPLSVQRCESPCKCNTNLLDDGGYDPCKIRAEKDNRNREEWNATRQMERHHERQQGCSARMSDIGTAGGTGANTSAVWILDFGELLPILGPLVTIRREEHAAPLCYPHPRIAALRSKPLCPVKVSVRYVRHRLGEETRESPGREAPLRRIRVRGGSG